MSLLLPHRVRPPGPADGACPSPAESTSGVGIGRADVITPRTDRGWQASCQVRALQRGWTRLTKIHLRKLTLCLEFVGGRSYKVLKRCEGRLMESICLKLRISLCWVGLSSNSWDNKGWDSSKDWFSQTPCSFGASTPAPLNKYCCLRPRL